METKKKKKVLSEISKKREKLITLHPITNGHKIHNTRRGE